MDARAAPFLRKPDSTSRIVSGVEPRRSADGRMDGGVRCDSIVIEPPKLPGVRADRQAGGGGRASNGIRRPRPRGGRRGCDTAGRSQPPGTRWQVPAVSLWLGRGFWFEVCFFCLLSASGHRSAGPSLRPSCSKSACMILHDSRELVHGGAAGISAAAADSHFLIRQFVAPLPSP